jgi:hypothetical protein
MFPPAVNLHCKYEFQQRQRTPVFLGGVNICNMNINTSIKTCQDFELAQSFDLSLTTTKHPH